MRKIFSLIIILSILMAAIPTAIFAAESASASGKNDAESILDLMQKRKELQLASVGSVITFGNYEQDNSISNGKEEIEWLVLAREGNRLLVISKYALDYQPYNVKDADVTWETCTLRNWLNTSFLQEAFSAEEKKMIPMVTVSADGGQSPGSASAGNPTQDLVFLLSLPEVKQYCSSEAAKRCIPSPYTVGQGSRRDNGSCEWWLRTTGYFPYDAVRVLSDGQIYPSGTNVNVYCAVRPVLWIEPNASVSFGTYEQDGDLKNGPEPIEWLILDVQENEALLLSREALASLPFEAQKDSATWEVSSLRGWLNDTFYKNAFSADEQKCILNTEVNADSNPKYGLSSGQNTTDKVFLLSIREAEAYFTSNEERVCSLFKAAKRTGAGETIWWWLRTAGNSQKNIAVVNQKGAVLNSGDSCHKKDGGVRPVVRVRLDSLQLPQEAEQEEALASQESVVVKEVLVEPETEKTEGFPEGSSAADYNRISRVSLEDCVTFGAYDQDNHTGNGAEGIDWLVLDMREDKVLLLSKYGLEPMAYYPHQVKTTWETSRAREWLNTTFLEIAFTEEERSMILMSKVTADGNPQYETDPGNDTEDRIFLLSIPEAQEYFPSDEARACEATATAKGHGAYEWNHSSGWWLRTPGHREKQVAYVFSEINYYGSYADGKTYVLRPAMWVKLEVLPEPMREYLSFKEAGSTIIENDCLTVRVEDETNLVISLNNLHLKEEGYPAGKNKYYYWEVEFNEVGTDGKKLSKYRIYTRYIGALSKYKSGKVSVEDMEHEIETSSLENNYWVPTDPIEVKTVCTSNSITWIIDLLETPINLAAVEEFDVSSLLSGNNKEQLITLENKESGLSVTLNDVVIEEDYSRVPGVSDASYIRYEWEVELENQSEITYSVSSTLRSWGPGRGENLLLKKADHKLRKTENHSTKDVADIKMTCTDTSITWTVDSWLLPSNFINDSKDLSAKYSVWETKEFPVK